jgi:hypothetical protein
MPTYRRPDLLRRAAQSLQAQTVRDWNVVVLDDSPGQEGRAVIESLNDPRFVYRPNARNLGAASNLDQAFQTRSYTGAPFCSTSSADSGWVMKCRSIPGCAQNRSPARSVIDEKHGTFSLPVRRSSPSTAVTPG